MTALPPRKMRQSKTYGEKDLDFYTIESTPGVTSGAVFRDSEALGAFLTSVCRSKIWKVKWKKTKLRVYLRPRWVTTARGGRTKNFPFIEIPDSPFGKSVHTIIHELAHALSGDGTHGPRFLKSMLRLMREFEGIHFAETLEKKWKGYNSNLLREKNGKLETPRNRR